MEQDFLRKLVQARLVRVEDVEGRQRYELAHEFLVQQIGTWIADSERELTKVLELIDRAHSTENHRRVEQRIDPAQTSNEVISKNADRQCGADNEKCEQHMLNNAAREFRAT